MIYTVSITSQGQISIPAKLRRKLGLEKPGKAIVTEKNGEIILRPVKDFLEMGGSLAHKAIQNKSIEQILKLEEKAIEQGFTQRHKGIIKQDE